MAQTKVTIGLPEEVLSEIDALAEKNFSNRSHTIVRVWLEWKSLKGDQKAKTENAATPTELATPCTA